MLTIGSLFSGIGGLELGLERAGIGPVIWQCERDAYCRSVLAKHWPAVPCLRDVREVSPATVERAELICGGFPCQDVSVAGRGDGLAGERSGLWFEFRRIVDECQPSVVVVENVTHGQSRWLPRVCDELEELGYVPAPIVLPAGSVGAPHVRARTFVVADTDGQLVRLLEQWQPARPSRGVRDEGQGVAVDAGEARRAAAPLHWAAAPVLGRVGDGLPAELDASDAADRIRALGNAVVPQVAEAIGRLIVDSVQNKSCTSLAHR